MGQSSVQAQEAYVCFAASAVRFPRIAGVCFGSATLRGIIPSFTASSNASQHRLAAEILQTCRADPDPDAPLVRALLAARYPHTGRPVYDDEICDELVLFMLAGHDTTSTVLSYALWALGRHRDVQDSVAAEVADLPDRALTHEDVRSRSFL